jgi:hypothetical protein
MTVSLRRIEAGVAGVLTLRGVWLHYLFATSAGPLWRDEANTVALATLPRLSDIWHNLQFDSFPVVWIFFIRAFAKVVGSTNDAAFRALGFLIGIALISALWFHAKTIGNRFPTISLSLFALSPSVVSWGDSMRAYGAGMLLIVVASACIWRFVEKPSTLRFVVATLIAVISVQTLYYNAVLLLALCSGAFVAALLNRGLKAALPVIGIGAIPALSLLPYISVISRASSWNWIVRIQNYTAEWFFTKLFEALTPAGGWVFLAWVGCVVLAFTFGAFAMLAPRLSGVDRTKREFVSFPLIVLLVGGAGSFLFLKELSYYTQPWYYLTFMLVCVLAIDVLFGAMGDRIRYAVAIVALGIGLATMRAPESVKVRMTNADVISARLTADARPGDLVIVYPWYDGVSVNRYYKGAAAWVTAPPISFTKFHRYDLVMNIMQATDSTLALAPVLASTRATLARGGTVYVVGLFPAPPRRLPIRSAIPVVADRDIQRRWSSDLSTYFREHSREISRIPIATDIPVSPYENMSLTALKGWVESDSNVSATSPSTRDPALHSGASGSPAQRAGTK